MTGSDNGDPALHPPSHHPRHFGLGLIAVLKLVKGILLLSAAIGILGLVDKNVSATVEHWITVLGMDPDDRYIHALLARFAAVDNRQLKLFSAGSFFYSALLLTEGIGLWLEQRWAEYLTVIATSSLVPLELYELARGLSLTKLVVLGINLVVVWYLSLTLVRERKPKL